MTNIVPVPSLSVLGWVTDASNKADLLLAHFFVSEKSQTYLYGSNVSSLPDIIQKTGHDPFKATTELQDALQKYLSRYYQTVIVNVTNDDNAANKTPGEITLTVNCKVIDNNIPYDVTNLIKVVNSKIIAITNLNNYGA